MDVVELTQSLCAIPSLTGEESEAMLEIERLGKSLGLIAKRKAVDEKYPNRHNLLLTVSDREPVILLSTHIDTVPPYFPVSFSEDREWLVGRGVCDAKGIAAAMLCAVENLLAAGERRVGLLFVVGEETCSDGAKALDASFMPKIRYIINGEPTDLKLVVRMKGAIVFDMEAKGKTGHSAYPEIGHSAVHQLCKDMTNLLEHPWPIDKELGPTTLNIGTVQGGVAGNVIAPYASARCVMRTTADVDFLLSEIRRLLNAQTELTVRSELSPMKLHEVSGFETCHVAFGSDVPHLKKWGVPLLIGPGSILDAHTAHEKIRIKDLYKAVELYGQLSQQLLEM